MKKLIKKNHDDVKNLTIQSFGTLNEIWDIILHDIENFKDLIVFEIRNPLKIKNQPGCIGINPSGDICIISVHNRIINDSILPEIFQYSLWADNRRFEIIKALKINNDIPKEILYKIEGSNIQNIIVAPRIDYTLIAACKNISYRINLFEINQWIEGENRLIAINQINEDFNFLDSIVERLPKPRITPSYQISESDKKQVFLDIKSRNNEIKRNDQELNNTKIKDCPLSIRAKEFCNKNNISDNLELMVHYKKNGSFLGLNNSDFQTNKELINYCNAQKSLLNAEILKKRFDKRTNESTILHDDSLNLNNLSIRARNIIKKNHLELKRDFINYAIRYKNFFRLDNCGIKTNQELIKYCQLITNSISGYPYEDTLPVIDTPSNNKYQLIKIIGDWQINHFSNSKLIITGDTKRIKDVLKMAGGRFYPNIKYNGRVCSGWAFNRKRIDEIMHLLQSLNMDNVSKFN